jgi:hypothetical protein
MHFLFLGDPFCCVANAGLVMRCNRATVLVRLCKSPHPLVKGELCFLFWGLAFAVLEKSRYDRVIVAMKSRDSILLIQMERLAKLEW